MAKAAARNKETVERIPISRLHRNSRGLADLAETKSRQI
jgi:hypothetical protein